MFICSHCHKEVSDFPIGTMQRNHCPFCLWSLHLDEEIPGDRKSNCHGLMQPIGLTSKSNPIVHLARHASGVVARHLRIDEIGELMLVHRCEKCGIFSKNRISGDDASSQLVELLNYSTLKSPWLLLNKDNESEVKTQLFGKSTNTK